MAKITFNDKGHILPYGTHDTQVWDLDINEIKAVVNANADFLQGLEGGYQGKLLIADIPAFDGYYLAGESGTYTNAGGLIVDLTLGVTFINVSSTQTVFSKTVVPVSALPTGIIEAGNLEAVKGGDINKYLELNGLPIIKEITEASKNLYNIATNRLGGYYNELGVWVVNAGYQSSYFIPVLPSTNYVASDWIIFPSWYDVDYNVVAGMGNTLKTFTTPSNVYFVRLGSTNAVMTNNLQLEVGTVSTFYVPYSNDVLVSKIKDFDSSVLNTNIDKNFKQLEPQKNLYNLETRTVDYYINPDDGTLISSAGFDTSDYIEVIGSTQYIVKAATFYAWFDADKIYISGASGSITALTSPSNAAYIRFSTGTALMSSTQQFELGSVSTDFEPFRLAFNRQYLIIEPKITKITVNSDLTSGADFTGNTALQDAIESITDATVYNRYILECTGTFEATQTTDYQTLGASALNFISGKNYVNVYGKGEFNIIATLPTFDNYYVPILWNCIADLENCNIIASNNRYGMHIEGNGTENVNYVRTFRNVHIKHDNTALGFGFSTGEELYLEDCIIEGNEIGGVGTYMHNNNSFDKGVKLITNRTKIIGARPIQLHSLGSGFKDNFSVADGLLSNGYITYLDNGWNDDYSTNPNHAEIKLTANNVIPKAFENSSMVTTCLKFTSKSTGVTSTVLFDKTSTAFNDIIGNSNLIAVFEDEFYRQSKNGYSYLSGSDVLSGYAISGLDISEVAGRPLYTRSLGKRLGDCSTVNKTLSAIIDGVNYNIIFNKNYDGQVETVTSDYTNAQIITEILAVIGTVCDVAMYALGKDYYPDFKGNKIVKNGSAEAILKGMGIVFTSFTNVRKATNADGRIDGIALDNIGLTKKGRVITMGEIYANNTTARFSTLETTTNWRYAGDKFGISATSGIFEKDATPTLLECVSENILRIK